MNINDMLKNKSPENADQDINKKNFGIAACGTFRKYAKEYYGDCYFEVDNKYTTRDCRKCSFRMPKFEGPWFFCESCGHDEDRDFHAAENIRLRAFKEIDCVARVA